MTIGFIGLGNMGAPMAINLAKAGHEVMGLDVSAPVPDAIEPASSLVDLASQADTIITMLPNGTIMADVVSSVLPHAKPGTLFLDCSTVDVASARDAAEQIQSAGHAALDAPVSGGTAGAAAGTLTFMVGGGEEAFARGQPLFEVMGAKTFHCGSNGSGQAAKICNNMILGISMIATCEAFALADGLELDRQALFNVVSASSGQCWSMTTYCPAPRVGPQTPADNDYRPGFATDLMLKDLILSQQAAQACGVETALGEHARALYQAFAENGGGSRDFSAILERIKVTAR
jgi:3-hydroxyisobutyrate dehydrogenase